MGVLFGAVGGGGGEGSGIVWGGGWCREVGVVGVAEVAGVWVRGVYGGVGLGMACVWRGGGE
jgi:hypothetical protein